MAASDPVPGVPTPTGTLQGCAAFSWDGANWQPAGAAYSSVATPTGVLRGVAPFSWSGSAWTPAGRSMPGVPTPTGTLDGVAVYTWSGSAWTPAGGGTTPTPTGTLQGIAAFYWDGTNWQPTGQAGAEVATPSGVLQGVAMFSWSGSAWVAASSLPPGVTLDLSFMNPGTLPSGVTLTRGSTATYFDNTGTMQTVSGNAPRWDYNPSTLALQGLLIEEARTNVCAVSVPNTTSWTPVNSTLTPAAIAAPDGTNTGILLVDNGTTNSHGLNANGTFSYVSGTSYTMSFYAKAASGHLCQIYTPGATFTNSYANFDLSAGTVGTSGGGTASIQNVGNGWYRCVLVAAATASASAAQFNLCLTNSSSAVRNVNYLGTGIGVYLWGLQTEAGAFPTSYIPTTGAAVTRSADVATIASIPGRNAAAETWCGEFMFPRILTTTQDIIGDAGSSRTPMYVTSTATTGTWDTVSFRETANIYSAGSVGKVASSWASPGNAAICLNAGAVATNAVMTSGFAAMTTIQFGHDSAGDQANGYIRRLRYWPRALSNTEMQQVTT